MPALITGRNPDVKQIYTSQSLFTIYVHSTPGHQHSKPSIFTGREIPDLVDVTNAYGQHALMKVTRDDCIDHRWFPISKPMPYAFIACFLRTYVFCWRWTLALCAWWHKVFSKLCSLPCRPPSRVGQPGFILGDKAGKIGEISTFLEDDIRRFGGIELFVVQKWPQKAPNSIRFGFDLVPQPSCVSQLSCVYPCSKPNHRGLFPSWFTKASSARQVVVEPVLTCRTHDGYSWTESWL